ncbi:MAG: hypothetical protein A2511_10145 [Deltaproteobacteria bacterium RIFOXYD12_FULL_50_9]|nr:MAG: hypothetical protein A2511_10145 [Deltaproteobacteria bacterium RIFOXYD12_FULL_50_9]
MEKRKPHYDLAMVRSLALDASRDPFTATAKQGGAEMGLSPKEMRKVVADLKPGNFYKSMTTHANHAVWQDVYRPETLFGQAYVKVTVYTEIGLLVVSFKRL